MSILKILKKHLIIAINTVIFAGFSTLLFANSLNPWVEGRDKASRVSADNILVAQGRYMQFNAKVASQSIGSDNTIIIPLANGQYATYILTPNNTMSETLANKFPSIRTYSGVDINNPNNKGSFDLTPVGFHGYFNHNGTWLMIDPVKGAISTEHVVYKRNHAIARNMRLTDSVIQRNKASSRVESAENVKERSVVGDQLRIYRLAVSASGEYTEFHSSRNGNAANVTDGLAGIVTTINRVNEVFERDLSIRFSLIGNNNSLIFTNPGTDPFDNASFADLNANQTTIDNIIGSANYDIGHLVTTGGGGVAVRAVCENGFKAQGLTGLPEPLGDVFNIDFVSHEIGHQMGANHSYNGGDGACGGQRVQGTSWEPGSGVTVMGYAGICGEENIATNSIAAFHIGSIEEILDFIDKPLNTCGTVTSSGNTVPVANAGSDVTVPSNTPMLLEGSGSDADNDSLTFSWEQLDTGGQTNNAEQIAQDDGSRALFRSFLPVSESLRYLPRLPDLVAGTSTLGEALPTTNRNLTFRLTARDGRGGVATDEKIITTINTAGPFTVTAPATGSTINGTGSVQWDVANTNQAPVNCSNVDIMLSTDSGLTFVNLLAQTPNDGNQTISYTGSNSTTARIAVKCSGNVFFGINPGNFSIQGSDTPSTDSDNDGINDSADNCPNNANADQLDTDSDGSGNVCDSDDDNDGLPDTYELANNLNPLVNDSAADADNDGATNLAEFLAGTDPNDSNSTPSSSHSIYDIDGNGTVDALTDGLLILRYLFNFRGDTLINGVVGANATRTTASDIEGYLSQQIPSNSF